MKTIPVFFFIPPPKRQIEIRHFRPAPTPNHWGSGLYGTTLNQAAAQVLLFGVVAKEKQSLVQIPGGICSRQFLILMRVILQNLPKPAAAFVRINLNAMHI